LTNDAFLQESRSTQYWDIASVFFICWVAFVVPFRIGFDVDVEIKTVVRKTPSIHLSIKTDRFAKTGSGQT
jgi:hypothetical protein